MPIAEVKGLPRYVKVLDVSAQNDDPDLDFTGGNGVRITAASKLAVPAGEYTARNFEKTEAAITAVAEENKSLKGELEALKAQLEAMQANQPAIDANSQSGETVADTSLSSSVEEKKETQAKVNPKSK